MTPSSVDAARRPSVAAGRDAARAGATSPASDSHPLSTTLLGLAAFSLLTGLAGGLLADWLQGLYEPPNPSLQTARLIGACASLLVLFLLFVFLSWRFRQLLDSFRRMVKERTQFSTLSIGPTVDDENVRPARALVILVSAGNGVWSAFGAARHHRDCLECLYLIHTRESLDYAERVRAEAVSYPNRPAVELAQLDDPHNVSRAKELVESLRTRALTHLKLEERDLICDFTGMTKGASSGMVLACAPAGRRLQYMRSDDLDQNLRPNPSTPSRPVEVRTHYKVSS